MRFSSSGMTLDSINRTAVDRIIRVDHAGEYGANRIYAGQMAVLGRTSVGPIIQVGASVLALTSRCPWESSRGPNRRRSQAVSQGMELVSRREGRSRRAESCVSVTKLEKQVHR